MLFLGMLILGMIGAEYCTPGKACWPGDEALKALDASLTGRIILPKQAEYTNLTKMKVMLHVTYAM